MARGDPQINLRVTESLRERLNNSAQASGRTITAEASYLLNIGLEESLYSYSSKVSLEEMREMSEKIEQLNQEINERFERMEKLLLRNNE